MKVIYIIAFWLLVLGGINWGLVAFFDFDLVLFTAKYIKIPNLAKILYGLIGISGLLAAFDNVRK